MVEQDFLVMAWKWPASEAKIIEVDDKRVNRIRFAQPEAFKVGQPRYAGDGVLLKMKELSFDQMEAGRPRPGFAIVKKGQLGACKKGRDVIVIGSIDALNKGLITSRVVLEPEPEPDKEKIGLPETPEEVQIEQDSKITCSFCRGRKGFNPKSYINHLKGFHLRALEKNDLTDAEKELKDAITVEIKEHEDGTV